jgi:hypothetical protein
MCQFQASEASHRKKSRCFISTRVARWHIFKPKIQIWVNFGGSGDGRCWHILLPFGLPMCWPFGILCGHLVYSVAIWYTLWPFGILCGHSVYIITIWYVLPVFVARRKIWWPWFRPMPIAFLTVPSFFLWPDFFIFVRKYFTNSFEFSNWFYPSLAVLGSHVFFKRRVVLRIEHKCSRRMSHY